MIEISIARIHWWSRNFRELIVDECTVYHHEGKRYAMMPDKKLHRIRKDGRVLRGTIELPEVSGCYQTA